MGGASNELIVPKNEGRFKYDSDLKSYVNYTTGDRYTGSFKNGQIDGKGDLIKKDKDKENNGVRFEGIFEAGKIKLGNMYICSTKYKNRHSSAYPCPFTPYFNGKFDDEEKPLTGEMYTANYVGHIENGVKSGEGISYIDILDPKSKKSIKAIYEGTFTNDKRHGVGKIYKIPRFDADDIEDLDVEELLVEIKKFLIKKYKRYSRDPTDVRDVSYNMDNEVSPTAPVAATPATPATPVAPATPAATNAPATPTTPSTPATPATPTATNAPATPAATNAPSTKVQGGRRKKTARRHRKMRTHKKRHSRK